MISKYPQVHMPMFGKTYSNGHEVDLSFALLKKPIKACMEDESDFAIW